MSIPGFGTELGRGAADDGMRRMPPFDPEIMMMSHSGMEGWVLDMCCRRPLADWEIEREARRARLGVRIGAWVGSIAAHLVRVRGQA